MSITMGNLDTLVCSLQEIIVLTDSGSLPVYICNIYDLVNLVWFEALVPVRDLFFRNSKLQ